MKLYFLLHMTGMTKYSLHMKIIVNNAKIKFMLNNILPLLIYFGFNNFFSIFTYTIWCFGQQVTQHLSTSPQL